MSLGKLQIPPFTSPRINLLITIDVDRSPTVSRGNDTRVMVRRNYSNSYGYYPVRPESC